MATVQNFTKLCFALLIGVVLMLLSSCGDGDGGGRSISSLHQSAVDYRAADLEFAVGDTIVPVAPDTSGTPVVAFSVRPALPDGLSFNNSSGVISGTPTAVSPRTQYTVTARNEAGDETMTGLILAVDATESPPIFLRYECADCSFMVGQTIKPMSPIALGGQIESYRTVEPLPPGLTINSSTGEITGTPLVTGSKKITIVGSDTAGQITADMMLTVSASATAPTNLDYGESLVELTIDDDLPMKPLIPVHSGGQCGSYDVTPALTDGLFIGNDGEIDGKPLHEMPLTTFTITCNPVQPSNLSFASALTSMLIPSALAQTPSASTTVSIKISDLKQGFFGLNGNVPVYVGANASDYYYDGSLVWSKTSDVEMTYLQAKNFCVTKPPILDGDRWDLPGAFQLYFGIARTKISSENKIGNHGWQLGRPGFWVEPDGEDPSKNFSYVIDEEKNIPLADLPNGNDTPIYVTCFLRKDRR